MAVEDLGGRGRLVEAVEAGLSDEFSAVILRGAIPHAKREFARRKGKPVEILRQVLPDLDPAEALIRSWARKQSRTYDGLGLGHLRTGGLSVHFDGYLVSPFALSVGIARAAKWRVQPVDFDYLNQHGEVFDPGTPIDEFDQDHDDLVIIPGMPHPSLHEIITSDERRAARVFTTHSSEI